MTRTSTWDKDIDPFLRPIRDRLNAKLCDYVQNQIRDLVERAYREGREAGEKSERCYPRNNDMVGR